MDPKEPAHMGQSHDDPLSEPGKLLTLLSLNPGDASWGPNELAAILRHQLDAPLGEIVPDSAHSNLRQMLADPAPSIESLERVKQFAKSATVDVSSGLPRDVATVLYLAVIIVARRAGHLLTKLDDRELDVKIAWAARRPWLDPDLRAILWRWIAGGSRDANDDVVDPDDDGARR
jgi:hypothetical protein